MQRRTILATAIASVAVVPVGSFARSSDTPEAGDRVRRPAEAIATGFATPEGPAFDQDGNLFFVNWSTSDIIKRTPEGKTSVFFNTGGIPAGLAFHPDGSLHVADEGSEIHGILRISPDGQSEIVVNEFEGEPLNGSNDLVFDRDGALYFSDPWNTENGAFYRLSGDGTPEQVDTGLAFPNGVALNAEGNAVFLAETGMNRLLRYSIGKDGRFGERELFAEVDGSPGPDGMAFDANGDLYVAHYGTGHIDVFDGDGVLIDQIVTPGIEITNLAFGGEGNRTLVVTDVTTASMYAIEMNVAGQPLHDGRTYD